MTILAPSVYAEPLFDATEELVEDFTANTRISAGRVLAAVARARRYVQSGYAALLIDAPPVDEYVALVIGLARKKLDSVQGLGRPARARA
jgi:hypothetical protein